MQRQLPNNKHNERSAKFPVRVRNAPPHSRQQTHPLDIIVLELKRIFNELEEDDESVNLVLSETRNALHHRRGDKSDEEIIQEFLHQLRRKLPEYSPTSDSTTVTRLNSIVHPIVSTANKTTHEVVNGVSAAEAQIAKVPGLANQTYEEVSRGVVGTYNHARASIFASHLEILPLTIFLALFGLLIIYRRMRKRRIVYVSRENNPEDDVYPHPGLNSQLHGFSQPFPPVPSAPPAPPFPPVPSAPPFPPAPPVPPVPSAPPVPQALLDIEPPAQDFPPPPAPYYPRLTLQEILERPVYRNMSSDVEYVHHEDFEALLAVVNSFANLPDDIIEEIKKYENSTIDIKKRISKTKGNLKKALEALLPHNMTRLYAVLWYFKKDKESRVGGKRKQKYTKTEEKYGRRCIYLSNRKHRYLKIKGEFVPYKTAIKLLCSM